jgi:hypothetical protein
MLNIRNPALPGGASTLATGYAAFTAEQRGS